MYEEQKRFTDIAIQINLAFWTSLIAINGITIAGFAIITTSYNFNLFLSLAVILPSVISCFLIINNFLLAKKQYEIIMDVLITTTKQEITENQKEKNIDDAKNKHKRIENNNNIVIALIIIQVIFFIFFIYFPFVLSNFFPVKNSIPDTVIWQCPYAEFHKPY